LNQPYILSFENRVDSLYFIFHVRTINDIQFFGPLKVSS
jgi:hypothetical protein